MPSEDLWGLYQQAVRDTIRERWEERRLLLRWFDYVRLTHRDAGTLEILERIIRLGTWYPALIVFARQVSDIIDAEAMAS